MKLRKKLIQQEADVNATGPDGHSILFLVQVMGAPLVPDRRRAFLPYLQQQGAHLNPAEEADE